MNAPEVTQLPEMKFLGITCFGDNSKNEIPQLWERCWKRVDSAPNRSNMGECFGICFQTPEYKADNKFFYMVAVEVNSYENMPIEMTGKSLPAKKYLIFRHVGPVSKLNESYNYIMDEYLPGSEYEQDGDYDFERYGNEFTGPDSDDSVVEIFIPVKS